MSGQSKRERREAAEASYHVQQPDQLCANCRYAELCGDDGLRCDIMDRLVADTGLCSAWQGE